MEDNSYTWLPLLVLRGLVCFPNMSLHFEVGRKKSIKALEYAVEHNSEIFLISQMDIADEDPEIDGLYEVGCIARISQMLRMPDNSIKVLVHGERRGELCDIHDRLSVPFAKIWPVNENHKHESSLIESHVRRLRSEFNNYASKGVKMAPDIISTVAQEESVGYLADFIAFNIAASVHEKNQILAEDSDLKRAIKVMELLRKESAIVEIDRKIAEQVKVQIEENHREYYLHEQLKAINFELYGYDSEDEFDEYEEKIKELVVSDSIRDKLNKELSKLRKMPQGSHEATVVRNYLDLCLELPWNKRTAKKISVERAKKILDRDFYAMDKVKERILEMLSVYSLAPEIKGQIICLVGPPGVGKTSIAKSIAECMGRNFARISLGGIHDESEIRGHRRTYIGAMPGKIISAVKESKSSDPLILLDEIDKLGSSSYKGDPAAALLEVLDGEQNDTFKDHFLDMPFDLSKVVFLTTANTQATIPEPLRDRMEIIELMSYTREEKFHIAKNHLVKKQIRNHGLNLRQIKITDDALYQVIDSYTREAGVRKLERTIATACRKAAKMIASGQTKSVRVTGKLLGEMLGKKRYIPEEILENDEVGIINGLAWTSVGGEIMQLEVVVLPGSGKLVLTGSLGDVMQESAKTALSYVRANADKYGIKGDFYKDCDVHIHATEGAVPKDGPSAGVAIATALVSALTGRAVKRDIAMTGEVTIKGRVLAIGGLKEKSMAAYRAGVRKVFIPKANEPDLQELDKAVIESVRFVPVSDVATVIESALVEADSVNTVPEVIHKVKPGEFASGRITN